MKHPIRRTFALILILITVLTAVTACGRNEAEQAAAALLDDCIACSPDAMAAVMGYDILSLTDIERYTLARMPYRIISSSQLDTVRWDVTVDTHLYDIMDLLNTAVLYSMASLESGTAFDGNFWILEQLNNGLAPTANFRAVMPMIRTDNGFVIDADRIGDDLRDALSGGAYSWYSVYRETFGEDDTAAPEGVFAPAP